MNPSTKALRQPALNHSLAGMSTLTSHPVHISNEEERASALLDIAIGLVDSAIDILMNHLETDDQMMKESKLMPGGSVGKHFRHVIETYQAFLKPLHPRSATIPTTNLKIDYDAVLSSSRRPVARSLNVCREAMSSVRDDLAAWGERTNALAHSSSAEIRSQSSSKEINRRRSPLSLSRHAPETTPGEVQRRSDLADELSKEVDLVAVTPTRQQMRSSVGRELWFCSLHAIHHFSMLRSIAVHELGMNLPVEFGTAPSTLLYRGQKQSGQSGKIRSKL